MAQRSGVPARQIDGPPISTVGDCDEHGNGSGNFVGIYYSSNRRDTAPAQDAVVGAANSSGFIDGRRKPGVEPWRQRARDLLRVGRDDHRMIDKRTWTSDRIGSRLGRRAMRRRSVGINRRLRLEASWCAA